jgi:predicted metal-dependent peptidase
MATATLDTNTLIQPLNTAAFQKAKDRVTKVRVRLLLQHPFFGNLATRLKIVDATDRLPTAAVDGRNMFINVNFVAKLNDDELMFLIAHEVMHCVFEHMLRRGDRRPDVWNMAGDFVINYLLERERIGQVIRQVDLCLDSKYKDMTTEEVYDSLMKNAVTIKLPLDVHLDLTGNGDEGEDGEGEGKDGNSIGKALSEEERKALQDEIKNAVLQSAQAAGAGKTPAAVARLIQQFTAPKMNWRDLLRIQLESSIKSDYSFTRPSRKAWHTGAVLPGMLPAEDVDICVAIDTSGSISIDMIRDFLSEVKGIMDNYDSWTIKVWCFDTGIHAEEDFTSDNGAYDIMEYEPGGGGGTDFEVNWEYMSANDIMPKQLVVFTDGYPCGGWGDENYCDTLWIINSREDIEAPFGVTAFYDHNA